MEPPGRREDAPTGPRLERFERSRGRLPGDQVVRIVRSDKLRRRPGGHLEVPERALRPQTALGRVIGRFRTTLFGRPIATEAEQEQRLSKVTGLAIFASDNISSSAYATEEAMRSLALAGAGALALTMPLSIAIVAILAVVVTSYLQVIRAYPQGGGSYVVASENLGVFAGLAAAAALLIDYVLTVSVSVAGGVLAITSAFPALVDEKVWLGIGFIGLLTVGNLRGVREAGLLFAGPTYFYVVSVVGIVAIGLFRSISGDLPAPVPPPETIPTIEALTPFVVLRAFSSGSVGLSGTEAVANGVTAFKRPEARNAGVVLVAMGVLFGSLFLAISFIATRIGLEPDQSETVSVLSLLTRSLVGVGPYYYVLQAATAVILILAANTSFSGFPRLASILATDRFMPRQFAQRGDRLAFSTGILALALISSLLLAHYEGSVTGLIPLYTVGVFIAFTLSQAGMVRHWMRLRERGWQISAGVNGIGAVVTFVVLLVVAGTKFTLGAWQVLAIMPLIVLLLYGIHRHYRSIEDDLLVSVKRPVRVTATRPLVVVPVSRLDRPALQALRIARGLSGDLVAVHVSYGNEGAERFKQRWLDVVGRDTRLDTIVSPYRALIPSLLRYVDAVDQGDRGRPIVVVLAEFVPRHWWEAILHNQTALALKLRLFVRRNTVVLDVPYHLDDPEPVDLQ